MTSSDPAAGAPVEEVLPRLAVVSRTTVKAAMGKLAHLHGLSDPDTAFDVLRTVSQRHNVKLRHLAAFVLAGPAERPSRRTVEPAVTVKVPRDGAGRPNRTGVVRNLMRTAVLAVGVERGTVQLSNAEGGWLTIEGQAGFARHFLEHFSYVDGSEGSACGHALARARQVFVDDVATSEVFTEPERRVVLDAGVQSVLSTPVVDGSGTVRGMVLTHFGDRRRPDRDGVVTIRRLADECGRWLTWYDTTVMPDVVAAVHVAAARVAAVSRTAG